MKFIELWPGFAVRRDLVSTVQLLEPCEIDDLPRYMRNSSEVRKLHMRVSVSYGSPTNDNSGRTIAQTHVLEPASQDDYKRILELLNGGGASNE